MVRSNIPSSLTVQSATILSATAGTATASKALIADSSIDIDTLRNVGMTGDATIGGDANVTGDVNAATGTIVDLTASGYTPVARTATSDGLTTGTIADAGTYQSIAVTSAGANNIIVLPTPTPGTVIDLNGGASGYELRSSAPGTVEIGDGTVAAAAESAIPALSAVHIICVSATLWVGWMVVDSTLAAIPGAAA